MSSLNLEALLSAEVAQAGLADLDSESLRSIVYLLVENIKECLQGRPRLWNNQSWIKAPTTTQVNCFMLC